jgi:hypothetical protein
VIARPQSGHWVEDIGTYLHFRGRYKRALLPGEPGSRGEPGPGQVRMEPILTSNAERGEEVPRLAALGAAPAPRRFGHSLGRPRRSQVCKNATAARNAITTAPTPRAVPSQPVDRCERILSARAIAVRMSGERVGQGVSLGTGIGNLFKRGKLAEASVHRAAAPRLRCGRPHIAEPPSTNARFTVPASTFATGLSTPAAYGSRTWDPVQRTPGTYSSSGDPHRK